MRRALRRLGWLRADASVVACAGLAWILAWAAVHDAQAQTQASEARATVEDRAEVTLVELPVVAIGADGRTVRGLRPEQFRVRVDGVESLLERVEAIDLEILEGLETFEALQQIPAAARRRFLLVFDLEHSSPRALAAARRGALELLREHLRPTDLVGAATLDGRRGAQWLMTFSGDRVQLARAVETLGVPGLVALPPTPDPLRFTVDVGQGPAGGSSRPETPGARRLDADVLRHLERLESLRGRADRARREQRLERWARSLGALGDALATLDGRTQVLLFSEGFDASLSLGGARRGDRAASGGALDGSAESADSLFGSPSLRGELDDALGDLRRAGAVLHAVDPGGLRPGGVDPTDRGLGDRGLEGDLASARGQDALFHLAAATGGRLLEDAGRLGAALEELVEASEVVYLLSFYLPRGVEPDRDLGLKVELESRGFEGDSFEADGLDTVELRHRASLRAPKAFVDLPAAERELLAAEDLLDARPREELPLELLATPFPAGGTGAYVPVVLELPSSALEPSKARAGADPLRLEIYLLALDDGGRVAGVHSQTLELARTALAGSRRVQYYGHLALEPGRHVVRGLVRDLASGRTGTASRVVEVPSWREPFLLPPFVPDDGADALRVREAEDAARDTPRVYPFVVEGRGYVPSPRPTLIPGQSRRVVVLHVGAAGDERLALRLERAEAEPRSQPIEIAVVDEPSRRGRLRQWTATIALAPETPPGTYSLVATLGETSSTTEATVVDPASGDRSTE